jgi:hypothetical protein
MRCRLKIEAETVCLALNFPAAEGLSLDALTFRRQIPALARLLKTLSPDVTSLSGDLKTLS